MKSLRKGWYPSGIAAKKFGVGHDTLARWREKYPECFDVITQRNINVNVERLNNHVRKIKERE